MRAFFLRESTMQVQQMKNLYFPLKVYDSNIKSREIMSYNHQSIDVITHKYFFAATALTLASCSAVKFFAQ